MGGRVFISHASADAATADAIVRHLEDRSVHCWISSRDIPPSAIYAEAIAGALQDCSACLVLVSAASNASRAVMRELELASHYHKRLLPVQIEKVEPAPGMDYYLRNTQWVDYVRRDAAALDRIVATLVEPAAPPPPQPRAAPAKSRKSAMPMVVLGGFLATLVGISAWWFLSSSAPAETLALPSDPVEQAASERPDVPDVSAEASAETPTAAPVIAEPEAPSSPPPEKPKHAPPTGPVIAEWTRNDGNQIWHVTVRQAGDEDAIIIGDVFTFEMPDKSAVTRMQLYPNGQHTDPVSKRLRDKPIVFEGKWKAGDTLNLVGYVPAGWFASGSKKILQLCVGQQGVCMAATITE